MGMDMEMLMAMLITWGPMLLLLCVWIYFMRKFVVVKQVDSIDNAKSYYSDHIAEIKRLNSNLERIAAAVELQNSRSKES